MNEKVLEWIEKANKDLEAAKLLLDKIPEYSAYHSQQAVEKLLKAFLIFRNKPFRKTHDIAELISLCSKIDRDFEKLMDERIVTKEKLSKETFWNF